MHRLFQSPQSGICFCEQEAFHAVEVKRQSPFNPLNLGSASARTVCRGIPAAEEATLSIPSIWDLLLRAVAAGPGTRTAAGTFNPLNLGSASASFGAWARCLLGRSPFNPLNLGSASARGINSNFHPSSVWTFNPLNLGSASARRARRRLSSRMTMSFNPLNLGSASASGYNRLMCALHLGPFNPLNLGSASARSACVH